MSLRFRDVLPLAFRVTYWDRLPEIEVDGACSHVGSDPAEVHAGIHCRALDARHPRLAGTPLRLNEKFPTARMWR